MMAYARFGSDGSEVYVYDDARGFLVCCDCVLSESKEARSVSRSEMIKHLRAHVESGHSVPLSAFAELENEISKLGDAIKK